MSRMEIMVGLLLLIAAPLVCAIGSVIARRAEHRFEPHRQSQRHKQLLIQALPELERGLPTTRVPHLSDRRLEMELLLMNVGTKAELLAAALAAEAEAGETIADIDSSQSGLRRWRTARKAAAQAYDAYAEAINEFHEFLHSLPPPMRARAAERGAIALAINPV